MKLIDLYNDIKNTECIVWAINERLRRIYVVKAKNADIYGECEVLNKEPASVDGEMVIVAKIIEN